jgi:hypothetical protein
MMLVLLMNLISRLINRSGLRISHSKVFSSGGAFVTITLAPPHPYPQHTYLDLLTNYFLK